MQGLLSYYSRASVYESWLMPCCATSRMMCRPWQKRMQRTVLSAWLARVGVSLRWSSKSMLMQTLQVYYTLLIPYLACLTLCDDGCQTMSSLTDGCAVFHVQRGWLPSTLSRSASRSWPRRPGGAKHCLVSLRQRSYRHRPLPRPRRTAPLVRAGLDTMTPFISRPPRCPVVDMPHPLHIIFS